MVSWIDWSIGIGIMLTILFLSYNIIIGRIASNLQVLKDFDIKTVALSYFEKFFSSAGYPKNWTSENFNEIGLIGELYRVPIFVNESSGCNRVNDLVDIYIELDEDCNKIASENTVRVYDGEKEVDSKIFNKTYCGDKFLKKAGIIFKTNISANSSKFLFIYFSPDEKVYETTYPFDIVGLWHFDEGSGSITYDTSGFESHGILVNDPTWVDGKFGKALRFDGIDDYVTNSSNWDSFVNSLKSTNQITVEAWVNLFGYQNNHPQSVDSVIRAEGMFYLRADSDPSLDSRVTCFFISNGTWIWTCTSNRLPLNTWTHLVGTWDGQNLKLYINGILINSTLALGSFGNLGNPNITIGATWNRYEFFNGTIDEVRIYNRALTEEEIRARYECSPLLKKVYPFESFKVLSVSKLKELKKVNYREVVKSLGGNEFQIEIRK
jgi:hypothetical protein